MRGRHVHRGVGISDVPTYLIRPPVASHYVQVVRGLTIGWRWVCTDPACHALQCVDGPHSVDGAQQCARAAHDLPVRCSVAP